MNLYDYEDKKYKEFSMKLTPNTKYPMIGIRIPILRKLSKSINYEEYLQAYKTDTYEEVMLLGMVIAKIKDEKRRVKAIKDYIKFIDCWSLCDTFCANLKFIKKDPDKYFNFVISYIECQKTYYIRFGLVMLLDYYLDEKYLDKILEKIPQITNNDYYVKMATSWLLCELASLYPERIFPFVNQLDNQIQKMFMRKVKDSYKIKM